jgi:colicin import membrane protein
MQRPANGKESSVLFSLTELMRLENEREQRERELLLERAREEERNAQEAARLAREAEQRRLKALEEEERARKLREREEQARLEAIRQGEIRAAITKAEHEARIAAMKAVQEHERAMAVLARDRSKRRATWLAIGSIVSLLAAIGAGGVVVHRQREQARELARRIDQIENERHDLDRKHEQPKSAEDAEALRRRVAELEKQAADLQKKAVPAPTLKATPVPSAAQNGAKKDDPCEDLRNIRQSDAGDPRRFDPINPCL